ncbi:MAG: glycosyltransferase family 4 protein [bacterium]|nr:glycosyltransferase family 4 protein [bacterium]
MKIALVHNLPAGGAKVVLNEWVKRLSKNHLIDEYCLSTSETSFYDTRKLVNSFHIFKYKKLIRFPPENKLQYLNFIFQFIDIFRLNSVYKNIANHINAKDYDIVLVTHDRFLQSPSCLRWLVKPTVYYVHEPQVSYEIREGIGNYGMINSMFNFLFPGYTKWVDRINTKNADCVLVNSINTQKNVEKQYKRNATVCYHGVDTTNFYRTTEKKENLILSIGALDPVKGHNFVIEAIAKLDNKIRPALKIFYDRGSENYKVDLITLAKKHNIELSFFYQGKIDELLSFYNKAVIVACAQINEPFGLVPLEAMSCGTPVVAVNEGGFKETIINGKTGILVERDVDKFAEAIKYLLTNEKTRAEYSQYSYSYIRDRWSWDIAITKLERILENIAKNR